MHISKYKHVRHEVRASCCMTPFKKQARDLHWLSFSLWKQLIVHWITAPQHIGSWSMELVNITSYRKDCRCFKLRISRCRDHLRLSSWTLNSVKCTLIRESQRELWLHIEEKEMWTQSSEHFKILATKTQVMQPQTKECWQPRAERGED